MSRVSLNGEWTLMFDPDNRGASAGWGEQGLPEAGERVTVVVPSLWNDVAPQYTGVAFYERLFASPTRTADERVMMRFDGVNHVAHAWVNGRYAGSHEGGYTPFQFDVTSLLREGSPNRLTLRVIDYPKRGTVEDRGISQTACAKETWYFTYGGVHAPVSLEVVPAVHLEDVQVIATGEGRRVNVRMTLRDSLGRPGVGGLRARVMDGDGTCIGESSASILLTGQAQPVCLSFGAPAARLWSPGEPVLYRLLIELDTAAGSQTVSRRFGFRDCAFRQGRFSLNGRPIQLKGVLLQPNYPVTLINPADTEMARREIRLIREAGFNCVRSHVRPAPEEYLDLCDEAGLLVYQESPCGWIGDSPHTEAVCRRELREMIVRDSRHPCIVMWGLLNENFQVTEALRKSLLRYSAELDPSRPCIDDSGVSFACTWDATAWEGQAWSIDGGVLEPVEDHHLYLPVPLGAQWYDWLSALGDPAGMQACARMRSVAGQLERLHGRLDTRVMGQGNSVFVSEFGYGSLPDYDSFLPLFKGRESSVDCVQYTRLAADMRAAMARAGVLALPGGWEGIIRQSQAIHGEGLLRMIEALRQNPRVSGYVVTQLNDASWEHLAGILDPWRKPKACFDYVRAANAPAIVVASGFQPDVFADEPLIVRAVVVNDTGFEGAGRLRVSLSDDSGKPLFSEERGVQVCGGINGREAFRIVLTDPGTYRLELRLEDDGGRLVCGRRERVHVQARVDYSGVTNRVHTIGAPDGFKPPWKTVERIDDADVIVVWSLPLRDPAPWAAVVAACRAGTRVIVLDHEPDDADLAAVKSEWGMLDLHVPWAALDGVFPHPLALRNTCGCFISNFHYVRESPLTRGLPANRLMDERWAGLAASYGLVHQRQAPPMAGTLCQSAFGTLALENAATLDEYAVGRGRWIFCQLRVKSDIGRGPLADRLMRNLIEG